MLRPRAALWAASLCAWACGPASADVPPRPPYAGAAAALEAMIGRELAAKGLPAATIALVDGDAIVWARGFGAADPARSAPATADSACRVGSVSKLFTDIAAMQLVELGLLDLDAPVARYLPGFAPADPFGAPVTTRQLISHRSGLVREPPVGHYFDATGPTLAATVRSLNATALVYEPGTRTKYSDAAASVVGLLVERLRGEPFAASVRRTVLAPLGLAHSDFEATPEILAASAEGRMWTLDGRTFPAPTFAMGIVPAGGLHAPASDLARFLSALFAGGRGPGGPVLRPETLAAMYQPRPGGAGFGLGFAPGTLDGRRRIGHGGAAYGFATELAALPDEKLGVAVIATLDRANAVTRRVADAALRAMLAARAGAPVPAIPGTAPLPVDRVRALRGRYASDDGTRGVVLADRDGRLLAEPIEGGSPVELRARGDALVGDDALGDGPEYRVDGDRLLRGDASFRRVATPRPPPAPERWSGLIGEYGWDHDILYILEKDGALHALIEWFFEYPLTEVAPDVFAFPDRGLYDGERLAFARDPSGRAARADLSGVVFPRRAIGGEDGGTFTITPLRPVAELRVEALAARPPAGAGGLRKPDLVDLTALDPAIKLDVRYATPNNFAGTPFYSSARAFLQRPAAEALAGVHRSLAADGFGLLIHDAYRPWYVTKMFWEATPPSGRGFVADPAAGSKHNRGCAVDLTLYDLATGRPAAMVGGYDEFSDRSDPDYPGGTSLQRWRRDRLRVAMESAGFRVNGVEWWHFDHRDWPEYPLLNEPFERLGAAR